MTRITYKDISYIVAADKPLLESLEQQQVFLPFSCREGSCQTCKMKVLEGQAPAKSQAGLKPTEQTLGYFLPCVCYPETDLVIADLDEVNIFETTVVAVNKLNHEIAEIHLSVPPGFSYYPGQYIRIHKNNGVYPLYRHYSLASVPALDNHLTLQIKYVPDGLMSPWMHDLSEGTSLQISGPFGECFYQDAIQERPLILMGTGSGLSPLHGILRTALMKNHQNDIWLFHGVNQESQLYHQKALQTLASTYAHVRYFPCLAENFIEGYDSGLITDIVLEKIPHVKNAIVFLAGSPAMINAAVLKLFLAGVSINDIYKDPFN